MSSKLIFLALAIMILIVPAMATPYPSGTFPNADIVKLTGASTTHYNVTPGNAIGSVVFTTPQNTNITFTLGYGNGNTISGEIQYVQTTVALFGGLEYGGYSYSRVAIGDNESSNTYLDAENGWTNRYGITGHAIDKEAGTKGLAVWDTSVLNFYTSDNVAYVPIDNIANKPIYWIDITSNRPVDIEISVGKQSYIQSGSTQTGVDVLFNGFSEAKQQAEFIGGIVTTLFTWLSFIWLNIGMIIALYIALTGFMAFKAGKNNILRSIQIFFGYQKKLFETLLALPYFIIDLADKIKSLIARWI